MAEELVKGLWVNGSQQKEGLSSCVQPVETDILALQSAEAAKESVSSLHEQRREMTAVVLGSESPEEAGGSV